MMETKIEVTYKDGSTEVLEGTVAMLSSGWVQISRKIESKSALASVTEQTDSVYLSPHNVLKIATLND